MGPIAVLSITDSEKMLKYSLLKPLDNKDHSAHKLWSLNEKKVWSVTNAIVDGVG